MSIFSSPVVLWGFSVPAPDECAAAAPAFPFSRMLLAAEPVRSADAPLSLRRLASSAVLPPAAGCEPERRPEPARAALACAGTPPRRRADAESASPDVHAPAAALHLRHRKRGGGGRGEWDANNCNCDMILEDMRLESYHLLLSWDNGSLLGAVKGMLKRARIKTIQ